MISENSGIMPPQRRYSLYAWPFQMLMHLWEWWTIRSQNEQDSNERIRRLNEREDRGLPPDEPWEKWR